jgi:hypothetical protein
LDTPYSEGFFVDTPVDPVLYCFQEEDNMTKKVFLIQVTVEGPEAGFVTAKTLCNFIVGEVGEQADEIVTYGVTEVTPAPEVEEDA